MRTASATCFEISIDEVAWRKGHRYLTLVGDHRRRCIVWGCEGKGQAAADRFFAELDPERPAVSDPQSDPPESTEIQDEPPAADAEHQIGERAAKLTAVSMDMGEGVRQGCP